MAEQTFNYFDTLRSGSSQKWLSFLNKKYIDTHAPLIKVFPLDKEATQIDELYGSVVNSRIYLPPYEIRAFHLDNKWLQVLGEGTMPYLETEEDITFVLNFEDMVQKIRDLKNLHISDIYINYTGTGVPTAIKTGNTLIIKVNSIVIGAYDLTNSNYNTTKKLAAAINVLPSISAEFIGRNDSSSNLVSFKETAFKNVKLQVFSEDKTYININDVIEKGDVILTHKWRLYETLSNMPSGDIGWDYATFEIKGNLRTLDKAVLPGNYDEQIKKHEYSLRDKIEME